MKRIFASFRSLIEHAGTVLYVLHSDLAEANRVLESRLLAQQYELDVLREQLENTEAVCRSLQRQNDRLEKQLRDPTHESSEGAALVHSAWKSRN